MRFHSKLFLGISFILLLTPSFFSLPVFPASANVNLFFPAELSQNFSHIILFSWDGVQYNHLMQLLNDGKMPVLQGIISQGVFVKAWITDHQTTTNPGHECLLSGRGGLEQIPDGLSVWENIENLNTSWVTGSIAGKSKFSDIIFPSYVYNDVDYWYAEDAYANAITDRAIEFVQNYSTSSFFLFVHFRDPDSAGHSSGENSPQYSNAIIECDTQVGRVMSALESEGILNSTAIIVTTDHGFIEGGQDHGSSPWPDGDPDCYTIFIACSQGTVEPAEWSWDQNDVAPTIYSLAGISDYQTRWSYLKGLALWDRTSGPSIPVIPFAMDGELDPQALLLAEAPNNTQQRHLWAATNGTFLYVATDIAGSYDVFILISQEPGSLQKSPWAKKGLVAKYDYYLAEEQSNGWIGWFKYYDEQVSSGVRLSLGSVLEGIINLEEAFIEVPPELYLTAAAYQTSDGGKLMEQVPLGNGDGDVNPEEFAQISTDVTPPVVSIIAPSDGAKLSGTVNITFNVFDENLENATLYLDGTPYNVTGQNSFEWDTTTFPDGNYTIRLVAFDKAGHRAEDQVTVVIENAKAFPTEIVVGIAATVLIAIVATYLVLKKKHSS